MIYIDKKASISVDDSALVILEMGKAIENEHRFECVQHFVKVSEAEGELINHFRRNKKSPLFAYIQQEDSLSIDLAFFFSLLAYRHVFTTPTRRHTTLKELAYVSTRTMLRLSDPPLSEILKNQQLLRLLASSNCHAFETKEDDGATLIRLRPSVAKLLLDPYGVNAG